MHIVLGLIVGATIGLVAGSSAVHFTAPVSITAPANQSQLIHADARTWDI